MTFKSEAITTLDIIKNCFRVSNEIIVDNAPKQTGYNIEMHIVSSMSIMDLHTTNPCSTWENKAEISIKIIKVNPRE